MTEHDTAAFDAWLGSDGRAPVTAGHDRSLPLDGQVLMHVTDMGDYQKEERLETDDLDKANVITSIIAHRPGMTPWAKRHKVVLDLDVPATLVPSSTPGHSHLFIDVEMHWGDYADLLLALARAGIVEPGYVEASRERRHTAVRLPWVRKEQPSCATTKRAVEDTQPLRACFGVCDHVDCLP